MLFAQTRPAFRQERVFQNARSMAIASILALGKHTISNVLATAGRESEDWSSAYRLFERERINREKLFAPARTAVIEHLAEDEPFVAMIDDTIIHKTGRKVHGAAWRRDPLGPAWQTNFVWGQRFVQVSAALPEAGGSGRASAIPLDFIHAPSPVKPRKVDPVEAMEKYKRQQKVMSLPAVAAQSLRTLRTQVPENRQIITALDGGYTNKAVFRDIPQNMILIGRIRKDARLFTSPENENSGRGRKKFYGSPLKTPEEIRQDDSIPWQSVEAYAAGKRHSFDVKVVSGVRWRSTGGRDVCLIVIRPLAYRATKASKVRYRDPAYLICSDPKLPLEQVLQDYLWRWEIELNFRDEKTVMGVGNAHVRTRKSIETLAALSVASYSFLLLAAQMAHCSALSLPRPKWYPAKPSDRCSTQQMIALFRSKIWNLALDQNKTHFVPRPSSTSNPLLFQNSLPSAVCHSLK